MTKITSLQQRQSWLLSRQSYQLILVKAVSLLNRPGNSWEFNGERGTKGPVDFISKYIFSSVTSLCLYGFHPKSHRWQVTT